MTEGAPLPRTGEDGITAVPVVPLERAEQSAQKGTAELTTAQALQGEVVIDNASIRRAARSRSLRGLRRRALSILLLLAIWEILSLFMDPTIVPAPLDVFAQMWRNLGQGNTYHQLEITMVRVLGGMVIAVLAGVAIGLVMGLSKLGEDLLDTWVLIFFTIPGIVYGILCILWFGLNDLAAIVAVGVGATPAVAINIWQGTKAIDHDLIHMGQAFRFSRRSILQKVVVPQLIPYILAALRYALGLSWKIVTIVELLGLSSGVGYTLNYWFGNFSMVQVLAWTLLFTVTLLIIEFVILKPVEGRLTRWRPVAQFQRGA